MSISTLFQNITIQHTNLLFITLQLRQKKQHHNSIVQRQPNLKALLSPSIMSPKSMTCTCNNLSFHHYIHQKSPTKFVIVASIILNPTVSINFCQTKVTAEERTSKVTDEIIWWTGKREQKFIYWKEREPWGAWIWCKEEVCSKIELLS